MNLDSKGSPSGNIELIKIGFSSATDLYWHETSLVFQRFNYFLIGMSFLIASFATVIVSLENHSSSLPLLYFAIIINGAGIWISFIFATMNYIDIRVINNLFGYVRGLEKSITKNQFGIFPLDYHARITQKEGFTGKLMFLQIPLLTTLGCSILFGKVKKRVGIAKQAPLHHAWIIPVLFLIIWGLLWHLVLPLDFVWSRWVSWFSVVSLIALLPILFQIIGFVWIGFAFKKENKKIAKPELQKVLSPNNVTRMIYSGKSIDILRKLFKKEMHVEVEAKDVRIAIHELLKNRSG